MAGSGSSHIAANVPWEPDALPAVSNVVDEIVRSRVYPSAAVLLGNHDGIVWTHVAPGDEGVRIDSAFPIASVTKPIVAAAVMQLLEGGYLRLDDPVSKFVPGFEAHGKDAVTIRHLLTHTSGLAGDRGTIRRLKSSHAPMTAYLEAARATSLRFEPGTHGAYCSLGFFVLAD